MKKHLILTLHILTNISVAVIAFLLPLNLVLDIQSALFTYFYIGATLILIVDFFNNVVQYRQQKKEGTQAEVLEHKQSFFLLAIDFLGALPIGLLPISPFFGIIRLVKIIRVAHYQSVWNRRAVRFGDYLKLLFFAFWITIVTHWLACGWLALHFYEAITDNLTLYIKSFYWSVVTLTTVGYGDIVPTTNAEIAYSIVVMMFGVGMYGYIIGNVANILSKRDPAQIAFQKNMDSLKAFVRTRNLPFDLQKRIRDYYAYLWKKRLGYDESDFMNNLPAGLKIEVEVAIKRKIIDKIPLFQNTNNHFLNDIAHHLKPVIYTPGEVVIREGDEGNEMFLVIKGNLLVYKNESPDQKFYLKDGDFFGELALLNNAPRNANVQALSYADLYVLKRDVFETVLARHPEIATKIKETAEGRR